MRLESFVRILLMPLLSLFVIAETVPSTQYAGFKEWKSENFGIKPDGAGIKIADFDNDGKSEFAAIADGYVLIYKYAGNIFQEQWRSPVLAAELNELAVGDADNDGIIEVIVSSMATGNTRFYVLGYNGSSYQLEWQSSLFTGDGYNGLHVYTDDSDEDGKLEIIVTSDEGSDAYIWIYDYNGSGYQLTWSSGLLDTYDVNDYYGLSNLDGDSFNEMIFGSEIIYVVGWNGTGYELEWESEWLQDWAECLAGNVNANAAKEIVGFVDTIRVYQYNGSTYVLEWESPAISATNGKLGDIDGDGIQEIIVGTVNGEIHIYGFNLNANEYQLEWQTSTYSTYVNIIMIKDIDGDDNPEILIEENADEDSAVDTGMCAIYKYNSGTCQIAWRDEILDSYFGGLLEPSGDMDGNGILEEVRFANSERRYYPYSVYVIGPAKQMPTCRTPLEGDSNLDCMINLLDLRVITTHWLQCDLIAQENCRE